jgi:hypothetical protein
MPEERRSRKKTLTWLQSHNINSFFSNILVLNGSSFQYGSLNERGTGELAYDGWGSIRFPANNGFFKNAGGFLKVGKKKGVVFDTIRMQKFI